MSKWPKTTGAVERLRNPLFREKEASFLARLDGQPVAFGRLLLEGGMAYLGGSGVMPEYRGQRVYATVLRRRLEEAHARGFTSLLSMRSPCRGPSWRVWIQRI